MASIQADAVVNKELVLPLSAASVPLPPDDDDLPPGWIAQFDEVHNQFFYVNPTTEPPTTQWERPTHPVGGAAESSPPLPLSALPSVGDDDIPIGSLVDVEEQAPAASTDQAVAKVATVGAVATTENDTVVAATSTKAVSTSAAAKKATTRATVEKVEEQAQTSTTQAHTEKHNAVTAASSVIENVVTAAVGQAGERGFGSLVNNVLGGSTAAAVGQTAERGFGSLVSNVLGGSTATAAGSASAANATATTAAAATTEIDTTQTTTTTTNTTFAPAPVVPVVPVAAVPEQPQKQGLGLMGSLLAGGGAAAAALIAAELLEDRKKKKKDERPNSPGPEDYYIGPDGLRYPYGPGSESPKKKKHGLDLGIGISGDVSANIEAHAGKHKIGFGGGAGGKTGANVGVHGDKYGVGVDGRIGAQGGAGAGVYTSNHQFGVGGQAGGQVGANAGVGWGGPQGIGFGGGVGAQGGAGAGVNVNGHQLAVGGRIGGQTGGQVGVNFNNGIGFNTQVGAGGGASVGANFDDHNIGAGGQFGAQTGLGGGVNFNNGIHGGVQTGGRIGGKVGAFAGSHTAGIGGSVGGNIGIGGGAGLTQQDYGLINQGNNQLPHTPGQLIVQPGANVAGGPYVGNQLNVAGGAYVGNHLNKNKLSQCNETKVNTATFDTTRITDFTVEEGHGSSGSHRVDGRKRRYSNSCKHGRHEYEGRHDDYQFEEHNETTTTTVTTTHAETHNDKVTGTTSGFGLQETFSGVKGGYVGGRTDGIAVSTKFNEVSEGSFGGNVGGRITGQTVGAGHAEVKVAKQDFTKVTSAGPSTIANQINNVTTAGFSNVAGGIATAAASAVTGGLGAGLTGAAIGLGGSNVTSAVSTAADFATKTGSKLIGRVNSADTSTSSVNKSEETTEITTTTTTTTTTTASNNDVKKVDVGTTKVDVGSSSNKKTAFVEEICDEEFIKDTRKGKHVEKVTEEVHKKSDFRLDEDKRVHVDEHLADRRAYPLRPITPRPVPHPHYIPHPSPPRVVVDTGCESYNRQDIYDEYNVTQDSWLQETRAREARIVNVEQQRFEEASRRAHEARLHPRHYGVQYVGHCTSESFDDDCYDHSANYEHQYLVARSAQHVPHYHASSPHRGTQHLEHSPMVSNRDLDLFTQAQNRANSYTNGAYAHLSTVSDVYDYQPYPHSIDTYGHRRVHDTYETGYAGQEGRHIHNHNHYHGFTQAHGHGHTHTPGHGGHHHGHSAQSTVTSARPQFNYLDVDTYDYQAVRYDSHTVGAAAVGHGVTVGGYR